jgi:spectinomycin phosphotransferase/16S rRNA (guanine(1405)-N(7))-methyltransferase
VLTPPDGLSEGMLVSALQRGWRVTPAALEYRAVGFGSHHWEVVDTTGTRWFVTVDDLVVRRRSPDEPLTRPLARLRASLAAAADLRNCGRQFTFVVAPVPALDGEPLTTAGERFPVALYPLVEGQSFDWGEFSSPAHRRGVLDLLVTIHTAPAAASRRALPDDFAVPLRAELEAALDGRAADPAHSGADADTADAAGTSDGAGTGEAGGIGGTAGYGPYTQPSARLLAQHAAPVRQLLARYDELVAGRTRPDRAVLTHGEPHPGNTMLGPDGWLLIDWDTVLLAPPERDLWSLDPGDGSILAAYAEATGVVPVPSMLELYRIRWDLADIALIVDGFRRPHSGSADDEESWRLLGSLLAGIRA